MSWFVLVLSGMLEAGWALALKQSHGFTRLWPSVLFVAFAVASFAGLSFALRSLPVGVAYGVWVGVGAATTAITAAVLLHERMSALTVTSLVLIVAGVVGLQLSSGSAHA